LSVTVFPPVLGPLMMLEGEGNDASSAGFEPLFEQRVAGQFEAETFRRKAGADAVVVHAEAGPGLERVHQRQDASAGDERFGVGSDEAGESDKDAVDLGLLFFEQPNQFVVLLDGFKRFNVDGLSGRAGAVNHAGDLALLLGFDGDDKAVPADGDEVVLRLVVGREAAQGRAQAFFDHALLALLLVADAGEFGARVIGECAVGEQLALDGFGE